MSETANRNVISIDRKSAVLLLFVLAMLAFDLFEHLRSPAYRYYRGLSDRLDRRCSSFEEQVKRDFVPAILSVASNRSVVVSAPALVSTGFVSSAVSPSAALSLDGARYFAWCGRPYFEYQGNCFTVGDDFFDDFIVRVTPVSCTTSSGHLFVFRSLSVPQRKMEVSKNVCRTVD